MMPTTAIEERLESEAARVLEIIGRVRDRPEGLNEADTKAALIDPILGALGWELRDPFTASQQYRHKPQDNPVDYALFILRSPVLFVEAKALNKDLSDYKWIAQTLAYASAAGVEWCALTNGDEYRIYNAFAKAEAEKKLFRRVWLSDRDGRGFCLETLLLLSKPRMTEKQIDLLWKAHFVDRQVREAVAAIFREPDAALVRMVARRTRDLPPGEVRESLRRVDVTVGFPAAVPAAAPPQLQEAAAEFEYEVRPRSGSGRTGRDKLRELIAAGVVAPPAEIEVTFKGQRFTASIEADGLVHFDGQAYASPSHAGGMVRNKVNGPPPDGRPYWSTNGWTFWRYRDATTGRLELIAKWLEQLDKESSHRSTAR